MQITDPETDLSVSLDYDSDGFPVVRIDTQTSGSYYDENGPTIEIYLNDEMIRPLFVSPPTTVSLSTLKDYLGQFEGNPDVVLHDSESDPDAIVLAHLLAELS